MKKTYSQILAITYLTTFFALAGCRNASDSSGASEVSLLPTNYVALTDSWVIEPDSPFTEPSLTDGNVWTPMTFEEKEKNDLGLTYDNGLFMEYSIDLNKTAAYKTRFPNPAIHTAAVVTTSMDDILACFTNLWIPSQGAPKMSPFSISDHTMDSLLKSVTPEENEVVILIAKEYAKEAFILDDSVYLDDQALAEKATFPPEVFEMYYGNCYRSAVLRGSRIVLQETLSSSDLDKNILYKCALARASQLIEGKTREESLAEQGLSSDTYFPLAYRVAHGVYSWGIRYEDSRIFDVYDQLWGEDNKAFLTAQEILAENLKTDAAEVLGNWYRLLPEKTQE